VKPNDTAVAEKIALDKIRYPIKIAFGRRHNPQKGHRPFRIHPLKKCYFFCLSSLSTHKLLQEDEEKE